MNMRPAAGILASAIFIFATAGFKAAAKVVKSVNGVAVKNLNHLVQLIRDSKDEFMVFALDSDAAETYVFPRRDMIAATDDILTDSGIRSQGSPDTLASWNAKP